MTNPLMQPCVLPPFEAIESAHVVPAIKQLIDDADRALALQLQGEQLQDWSSLLEPIEAREDKINHAWTPVSHLHAVMNNDALRKAYEEAEQLLTNYSTRMGQNTDLYRAYKALRDQPNFAKLSQQRKQAVDNALRDFKLSGVALDESGKQRYAEIQAKLSSLTTQFSNNVLDASHGWYKQIESLDELAGMPEFAIAAAQQAAQQKNVSGYVFTLDVPVYMTVMAQAQNRDLRKEMYIAYCTRASDRGPQPGEWDNEPLIKDILSLRQELATLLGFDNYAELSIEPKMASSTEQVLQFLHDLAQKSRPQAEKELDELKQFAKDTHGVDDLEIWDIPYYSEKLKIEKYSISQEALRPFFPIETVLSGLFEVAKRLFEIDVRECLNEQTWHKDAKYYEIFFHEQKIASFYLDLYAREDKRGGAWMAECRVRRLAGKKLQLPVAYLVCNFNGPVGNRPALLTHNEVTTLFHEFGHGLHHMLTKVDVAAVSGINGVAWDAVELPSQFMENFCWEKEVLRFLSRHYETGEPLSEEMIGNMIAAKNFQSAMHMLRQIELAMFDFRLHLEYGAKDFSDVQALLDEVRQRVAVVIPPKVNKFQNGFSHIFAGGYAAGYYSYKWAEVLSADAYACFEENGIFDKTTGQRYLNEILQCGGSQDISILFKNFRGREPSVDPLLRHQGIT